MTTPPTGTYLLGASGRLTVFEPVTAANPPAGSESWPVAELTETARLTVLPPLAAKNPSADPEIVALSRQIAERLAMVPPDQRAALLAEFHAEVARVAAG